MKANLSHADVIRQSCEMIQESAKLKQRARDTISKSAAIVDRSRELLAHRRIDGTPGFPGAPQISLQEAGPKQQQPSAAKPVAPSSPVEAALERVEGKDFVDEVLRLDGRHFIDCTVRNCVLEYSGTHIVLESTTFSGCRFRFGGEAALTIAMLECFGLFGGQASGSILPPLSASSSSSRVN